LKLVFPNTKEILQFMIDGNGIYIESNI